MARRAPIVDGLRHGRSKAAQRSQGHGVSTHPAHGHLLAGEPRAGRPLPCAFIPPNASIRAAAGQVMQKKHDAIGIRNWPAGSALAYSAPCPLPQHDNDKTHDYS
ncbi:hypothetical protein NH8B_0223 [Pseudogulbenkiania sp. NH8B]|nr:hypothetical protein NH8B_0223 [Pseudogulbenkiania sp. NH8B]